MSEINSFSDYASKYNTNMDYFSLFGGGAPHIDTRKIDSFESLAKYPKMRERLQNLLEQGEKITPKQWKVEIQSL